MEEQRVSATRETKETQIKMTLSLAGPGEVSVDTGLPFFDHILSAMAFHGGFAFVVEASGDLDVDPHHLVEDTGLVLGGLVSEWVSAYGPIRRFGAAFVPMDEALAHVVLDICGRPAPVLDARFPQPRAGVFDLHLTREFWNALAARGAMALHGRVLYGENAHHMVEALFKALGMALKEAAGPHGGVRSTKGVLDAG